MSPKERVLCSYRKLNDCRKAESLEEALEEGGCRKDPSVVNAGLRA